MWLLKLMANLLQSMATIGVLPPSWEWNGFILYALDISSRLIYCKTNRAASEPPRELNPWNWNSCCHCSSCYRWHPGIRSLPPSKIMRSPCIHFAAPFTFPVPRASFFPPTWWIEPLPPSKFGYFLSLGGNYMPIWPPVRRWLPRPISGNYTVCVTGDKNLEAACENSYFPINRSSALSTQGWLCCGTAQ